MFKFTGPAFESTRSFKTIKTETFISRPLSTHLGQDHKTSDSAFLENISRVLTFVKLLKIYALGASVFCDKLLNINEIQYQYLEIVSSVLRNSIFKCLNEKERSINQF